MKIINRIDIFKIHQYNVIYEINMSNVGNVYLLLKMLFLKYNKIKFTKYIH